MEIIQIATTFGDETKAQQLADRLVSDRLVACVQIDGPIKSTYRWQDKVEHAVEWRLMMKTRRELFDRVAGLIVELHDYDVPQVVATKVAAVSDSYAEWLGAQLIEDTQ